MVDLGWEELEKGKGGTKGRDTPSFLPELTPLLVGGLLSPSFYWDYKQMRRNDLSRFIDELMELQPGSYDFRRLF